MLKWTLNLDEKLNMNSLILFDIDGTLIHYINGEDQAYLDAVKEISHIENVNSKWDEYRYSTESGILAEIFYHHLGRYPTQKEIAFIKTKYVSSLSDILREYPNPCLSGVDDIFLTIKELQWDMAIATGAWLESAKVKLEGSGMTKWNIPIAHGDDHYERKDIILTAIHRAKKFYKKEHYETIVYVGDRPWDRKAALALNIGFIGVGHYLGTLSTRDFYYTEDYQPPLFLNYLHQIGYKTLLT